MQSHLMVERVKRNVSQAEIARYLGISAKQYRSKEKGINCFTSDEMFKLADFFGAKLDDIFLPRESTK